MRRYLVKCDNVIYYYADGWIALPKDINELVEDDFINYGILEGSLVLSKTILSQLGDQIEILSIDDHELNLEVLPHPQLIIPTESIKLTTTYKVKSIYPADFGNVYRVLSVDDGTTWYTFKEGMMTRINLSEDEHENIQIIKEGGIPSSDLSMIPESEWIKILPTSVINKKIKFLMVIIGNNKTYDITVVQDRYGSWKHLALGIDYKSRQYVNALSIILLKSIPKDLKILFKI